MGGGRSAVAYPSGSRPGLAMSGKNYTDLIVWQKAMGFVEEVYRVSGRFPREEVYGLTAQIRRAAVSVPSNIAEGQGRRSRRDFRRFLRVAHGSLREVETQVLLAERLHYLSLDDRISILRLSSEIGRLLNGLARSLSCVGSVENGVPRRLRDVRGRFQVRVPLLCSQSH